MHTVVFSVCLLTLAGAAFGQGFDCQTYWEEKELTASPHQAFQMSVLFRRQAGQTREPVARLAILDRAAETVKAALVEDQCQDLYKELASTYSFKGYVFRQEMGWEAQSNESYRLAAWAFLQASRLVDDTQARQDFELQAAQMLKQAGAYAEENTASFSVASLTAK